MCEGEAEKVEGLAVRKDQKKRSTTTVQNCPSNGSCTPHAHHFDPQTYIPIDGSTRSIYFLHLLSMGQTVSVPRVYDFGGALVGVKASERQ